MATTTPNFGWPVPTSSDLVKNGATAIEGLGDAIDASLLDLKGGTSGQVLAKASGTDMDFSWVTDATGIPATILDAKGDIIAATAADTASRLAVGTNGQVLTADSTAATGIKWATASGGGFSYTSYTPTYSNFTLGNGTVSTSYATSGDFVHYIGTILWGSTSSASGIMKISLPATAYSYGGVFGTAIPATGSLLIDDSAGIFYKAIANCSSTELNFVTETSDPLRWGLNVTGTVPMTWTNADRIIFDICYRKA